MELNIFTCKWRFTQTTSVHCVARNRIIRIAIALLFAILPEESGIAFRLTVFANPSSAARASARLGIARTILTLALLLAILSE